MPNCDVKNRVVYDKATARRIRIKLMKELPNCSSKRVREIMDEIRDEINEEIIKKAKKK